MVYNTSGTCSWIGCTLHNANIEAMSKAFAPISKTWAAGECAEKLQIVECRDVPICLQVLLGTIIPYISSIVL